MPLRCHCCCYAAADKACQAMIQPCSAPADISPFSPAFDLLPIAAIRHARRPFFSAFLSLRLRRLFSPVSARRRFFARYLRHAAAAFSFSFLAIISPSDFFCFIRHTFIFFFICHTLIYFAIFDYAAHYHADFRHADTLDAIFAHVTRHMICLLPLPSIPLPPRFFFSAVCGAIWLRCFSLLLPLLLRRR